MTLGRRPLAFVISLPLCYGLVLSVIAADAAPPKETSEGTHTQSPRTDSLGDPLPKAALLRMGTIRFRHPSSIVAFALSPDEKVVVTMDDDIIAWDAATGKELWREKDSNKLGFRLPHASYGVRGIAFSPDGRMFYTPGQQNEVIAWHAATGERNTISVPPRLRRFFGRIGNGQSRSIDVSPDGNLLATGDHTSLVVCNRHGKVQFEIANNPDKPIEAEDMNRDRLRFGGDFSYGRFSPDGKLLAVVNSESPQEIRLHAADTGKELRRVPLTDRLVRLAFSPDSGRIIATERDSTARLYDVATGEKLWDYKIELKNKAESYTSAVAFSPDAQTIAVCAPIGSDYDIHLLNAADGKRFGKPLVHAWKPWAVAFTADSKTLYSSGWDGVIRRWDVATQTQISLPGEFQVYGVTAVSPDGKTAAYCDDAGSVHLVNVADGGEIRQLKLLGTSYAQLAFSPDSGQLAGAGTVGDQVHVVVWNLSDGQVLNRWDWPKGRDPHSDFTDLCYSSDGRLLAGAVFRQDTGYVWDLATGQQIAELPHRDIHGISFSPENRRLATAGWDKVVRIWDAQTGQRIREFDVGQLKNPKLDGDVRMHSVRYSPQNNLLATLHLDSYVRIWDADDLRLISQFDNGAWFTQGGSDFSPDGQWYATGDGAGQTRLWDPLTGQKVWDRGRQQGGSKARGFGGIGQTLVTGDEGNCYLWDLRPADVPLDKSVDELWTDLAGDDSPASYRAIWALAEQPAAAVNIVGEKLRAVEDVTDISRVGLDESKDEQQRRQRLTRVMIAKRPGRETLATVQRATSLLAQIGTPAAETLLKELSNSNNQAVRQSAAHALMLLQRTQ